MKSQKRHKLWVDFVFVRSLQEYKQDEFQIFRLGYKIVKLTISVVVDFEVFGVVDVQNISHDELTIKQ